MESIGSGCGQRVGDIAMLTDAERHRVVNEFNRTTTEYPLAPIPGLFADQVVRRPDAAAITSGNRTLTYAELDARANQLARVLRARGATTESVVAVAVPQSIEFFVATLAILKVGAASLPVDLSYPIDRQ